MKAILLVGGEGTRLRPLTFERPKPLLPIANVPFVERTLARLAAVGCDEVVLSTCYRSEAFDRFRAHATIPVRIVVEEEPLGTGGAIGYAAGDCDDTFLVLNGDTLTDLDLKVVLDFHRRCGGEATIVLTPVDDPSRFGVVPTDTEHRVKEFIEKPAPGTAPTNMINAGTYVCEPSMLRRIRSGGPVSVEREVFPGMATDGVLYGYPSDAYWLDFGTIDTYMQGNFDCLAGRCKEPVPGAEHGAGVWVDEAAQVEADVRFVPPVAVGAHAVVQEGAVLGPYAAIANHAMIGAEAEVTGSVVLDGAVVGPKSRVDGSVVGFGASVPSWTRLGSGSVLHGAGDGTEV